METITANPKKTIIRHKSGTIQKSGNVTLDSGEEINIYKPKIGSYQVETSFVQAYYNSVFKLCSINGCAKDLLWFMCIKMDKDNIVTMVILQKKEFISKAINESGVKLYSLRTVDNALTALKKRGLIRKISQGSYLINPEYFFKDDIKRDGGRKRIDMIRLELEFQAGEKKTKMKTTRYSKGKQIE